MAGTTLAPWSIPYPTGTDRVMDGDNAIQAVADRMQFLFNQNIKAAPTPQTQVAPINGWGGQVSYFTRNGMTQIWFNVSRGSWQGNDIIAYYPAPARPYLSMYSWCATTATGFAKSFVVGTDGALTCIGGGTSADAGIIGSMVYFNGNTNP